MQSVLRVGTYLLLSFTVTGCAINKLRLDDASNVAASTEAASAGLARFLTYVDDGRRATNITLAAVDPACASLKPLLRQMPAVGPSAPAVGFLCVDRQQSAPPPGNRISLVPIADDLEPTIKLSEALAAYGEGLAAIVENDPGEASKPLLDALSLAVAAQDAASAIVPSASLPIPAVDDSRVTAAASLINFIGGLVHEANQVKDVRAYLSAHPDGAISITDTLKRHVGNWERARSGDAGLLQVVTDAQVQTVLLANPPASANARRNALENYYTYDRQRRDEAKLAPTLLALIDAVASADKELRGIIIDQPKLSASQRRQVAALNRERIIGALKRVADLARAIRGA